MNRQKLIYTISILALGLLSLDSDASFIETTLGTAVVNDATAAYFNPAALVLLKNSQIIPLGTIATFNTKFSGQSTTVLTGFTQSGTSSSSATYYSPSLYSGMPIKDKVVLGFAFVSNYAYRNPEDNSILRYIQSSDTIQDYDAVPSVGIRINPFFSLGAGINFSYTNFNLHSITGFPGSNIADSQSNNQSDGSGVGGNVGFLLRPNEDTLVGFNYRTVTTYKQRGKSISTGATQIVSNNYQFNMHTPARSILSISQRLTPKFGMIATTQYTQWGIVKNIHISGIATPIGILVSTVPQYLHNTWLFTLGANYRLDPRWIVRAAATYNQSPGNRYYQITIGDSYVLGASVGCKINKTITLDGSYAHAFIQDENININGNRFITLGKNQSVRNVISLKMTLNL